MSNQRASLLDLWPSIGAILLVGFGSFFIGTQYDTSQNIRDITLSCDPKILASLAIPKHIPKQGSSRELTANSIGVSQSETVKEQVMGTGAYFGSKNGTKYYPGTCASGKKRIKPENIIWFSSGQEAEIRGYSRSSSC